MIKNKLFNVYKKCKKIMITIIIIIIIIIIMIIKTKYIYCNLSQWLTFTENCLLEARYKKKKKELPQCPH